MYRSKDAVRKKLRKLFCDFVQKGFEDRVYQSFVSGVVIDDTTGYEDDRVRISALAVFMTTAAPTY